MYANISFTEFLFSNSGHVKSHEGLSLGWIAGILSGLAALISMPNQAGADPCYGISHGSCDWVCTGPCGDFKDWSEKYCHHTYPENNCNYVTRSCTC